MSVRRLQDLIFAGIAVITTISGRPETGASCNQEVLAEPMAEVSRAQILLLRRLTDVGMALRYQASLAALTADVVKTNELEGQQLDIELELDGFEGKLIGSRWAKYLFRVEPFTSIVVCLGSLLTRKGNRNGSESGRTH